MKAADKATDKDQRAREIEFVRKNLPQCADLLRAAYRTFNDPRSLDWSLPWLNFGTALWRLCRSEEDLSDVLHKVAFAIKGKLPAHARDDVMLLEALAKAKRKKKVVKRFSNGSMKHSTA
jgi:hypothetical protein